MKFFTDIFESSLILKKKSHDKSQKKFIKFWPQSLKLDKVLYHHMKIEY